MVVRRSPWETGLQLMSLAFCFGLPLLWVSSVAWAPLSLVLLLAIMSWVAVRRSPDPFLSDRLVVLLCSVIYANAAALSLSAKPSMPILSISGLLVASAYLIAIIAVIARASHRVADIDLEYCRYSLPSKRLTVDMKQRSGQLDQLTAATRLQLFVKEGLQFRKLSRVSRLLVMQAWGGLLLFLVFGMSHPEHLLISMATCIIASASLASIASRATLHPGEPINDVCSP